MAISEFPKDSGPNESNPSRHGFIVRLAIAILSIFALYLLVGAPAKSKQPSLAPFLKKNPWLVGKSTKTNLAKDAKLITLKIPSGEKVTATTVGISGQFKKFTTEQFDISTQHNLSLGIKNFQILSKLKPVVSNQSIKIEESGEVAKILSLNESLPYKLAITESGVIYSITNSDKSNVKEKGIQNYFTSFALAKAAKDFIAGKNFEDLDLKKIQPTLPLTIKVTRVKNKSKKDDGTYNVEFTRSESFSNAKSTAVILKKSGSNEKITSPIEFVAVVQTENLKTLGAAIVSGFSGSSLSSSSSFSSTSPPSSSSSYSSSSSTTTSSSSSSMSTTSSSSTSSKTSSSSSTSPSSESSSSSTSTSSSSSSSSSSLHCTDDGTCATKGTASVCDKCNGILIFEDAVCKDDTPTAVPTPCASDECCIGAACTKKTGEVTIELDGDCIDPEDAKDTQRCSDPKKKISYSNQHEISGTATVDGLNTDSEECTLTVTSSVGTVVIDPEACKPGTGSCSFKIIRDLVPGSAMCGTVTATASAACCSKETEQTIGLSNYGINFSPGSKTIREGPNQPARRPRIQIVPFPGNLKVTEHSEKLHEEGFNYKNWKGPSADTESVNPSPSEPKNNGVFRITNSWWVGDSKNPPLDNLCWDEPNQYLLSTMATLESPTSCSLSYDSDPDKIFFKLKSKFNGHDIPKAKVTPLRFNINKAIKVNSEWKYGPKGESYCVVSLQIPSSGSFSYLLNPTSIEMPWDPAVDQYYDPIRKEERRHTEQATKLNWAQGGLYDVLDWKYVKLQRRTFSAPTCYAAKVQMGAEVDKAFQPLSSVLDWYTAEGGNPYACWKEQTAKEFSGLDVEHAGFHLECAYKGCPQQSTPPVIAELVG